MSDQNRARNADPQGTSRNDSEMLKFAKNRAVLTQRTVADPSYSKWRTGVTGTDTSPVSSAPTPRNLRGYRGLNGYVDFQGSGSGESVTVQLWARDETANKWFLVDSVSGLSQRDQFRLADGVLSREVALIVSALTLGGYTSVDLYATAE